ncbi:MAG: gamma-glutamyltransferase family protein [Clostridiales bacterium]|jgi:gamma-glutamyltranspeptidase/glutathione hydrolase|nr:gamma-glutamyltransferase family protein [Clostridiales bacterium]
MVDYGLARKAHFAGRGMVATSHPLAAAAGLEILREGGNAVDAAIATAACLTVVEPTSNGIGGDAFAILWANGKLHGLNGSGAAPEPISIEKVRNLGHEAMPRFGFAPVTVPGAVGAWAELSARFGKLSLARCLAPAVEYARHGHPVASVVGKYWKRAFRAYGEHLKGEEFANWFKTFESNLEAGRPPAVGEIWKSVEHAATLEEIGRDPQSFYTGALAKQIVDFSAKFGGFLSLNDLASYAPKWVEPICANYHGHEVWQIPPNGQGLVALIALNILAGFELKDDIESHHIIFEAMKLAFTAGKAVITDPKFMAISAEELLSSAYAEKLRQNIGKRAAKPASILPNQGGTVYLATADDQGNMISYIQSNYMGFGSGLVVPGTGIALQNRGADFSLDPAHANALAGGKLTYHTIIPGFLTRGGAPIGPFGVMGGYMQPQGHVQVILNTIHRGLDPQQTLDAPRWQWMQGQKFEVEHHFPRHLAAGLSDLGHQISTPPDSGGFGRGQIIWRAENGALCGGTESRCDGHIAGF